MTMANQGITPERAAKILQEGKLSSGGVTIYVYESEMLSDLPKIDIDSILDTDIVIHSVKGTITGTFGESYVTEIGSTPKIATHSFLINCTSVLGKQIKRFADKRQLPVWAHVTKYHADSGNSYYTFLPPKVLTEAAPQRDTDNRVEDLPF